MERQEFAQGKVKVLRRETEKLGLEDGGQNDYPHRPLPLGIKGQVGIYQMAERSEE